MSFFKQTSLHSLFRHVLFLFLSLSACLFCFDDPIDAPLEIKPFGSYNDAEGNLMRDLLMVDYLNRKMDERFPVTFNHFLQGGYLNMPSSRMGEEGEISFGYSWVPPYHLYNLRCQPFSHLEITGNYRVFSGFKDPVLGAHGFGDFADKGANLKLAIWLPEDSRYVLPGLAFGFDDIIGTRAFKSQYVVATQVFLDYNFEISVGYGLQRLHKWFGGVLWAPWRTSDCSYLKGISLTAEYDATDYKHAQHEPHPKGREQKSKINYGIKYRLWDYFDFSASVVRGKEFAFSGSVFYNFGETPGFLPKIDDPLPYTSPVNVQPTGVLRPEDVVVQDFLYALEDQGFELLETWITINDCNEKVLRLKIYNPSYLWECDVRQRINNLLAFLTPSDIEEVIVVMDSEGFPIQEYHYHMLFVREFAEKQAGEYELNLLSPQHEVSYPDPCRSHLFFKQKRPWFVFDLLPKTQTYFGSAQGKFQYALGFSTGGHGIIGDGIYYQFLIGYMFTSSLNNVRDMDRLNPSQLINVKTDIINYYKQRSITLDRAFLQKCWNMGNGFYSRLAAGHFEVNYGGLAAEFLYYPVNSCWAIGLEGVLLRKRNYTGITFNPKIRKLHGFTPSYVKFHGSQYFLDLYYDWKEAQLDFKISGGKFLANDYGVRFEVARNFNSGLRLYFWYTMTNAHDKVNGQTYYDKGVGFSMPLDIFFSFSTRDRWGYGMSAWLRDCGYRGPSGKRLYEMIHDQRQ